jgi:hypothetical protein
MADGTAVPAPPVPAAGGQQSGASSANTHPEAKPGETKAQTVARIKADLGDGEREYEQDHVLELARRGRKTAQTMSKAEQRFQETQREREALDAKLARLKSSDIRERRAALKDLGLDEMELARSVAEEVTALEQLTPEQRRIRELEEREAAREAEARKAKDEEGKKAQEAEVERHREEFANVFLDVTQRAGIPRESAQVAFHRLAAMYQAAGGELDPDVAAVRLKDALRKEHTALYRKQDGALDLDAFEASLTPEDWKAINRRAVEKYRASRGAGGAPRPPPVAEEQPVAPTNGTSKPGNFWKRLEKQYR